jgi:hypothetical protein
MFRFKKTKSRRRHNFDSASVQLCCHNKWKAIWSNGGPIWRNRGKTVPWADLLVIGPAHVPLAGNVKINLIALFVLHFDVSCLESRTEDEKKDGGA